MRKIYYKGKEYIMNVPDVSDVRVNGTSVVSNNIADIRVPVIHMSTSDPTPSDGQNGDIWLIYEEPETE